MKGFWRLLVLTAAVALLVPTASLASHRRSTRHPSHDVDLHYDAGHHARANRHHRRHGPSISFGYSRHGDVHLRFGFRSRRDHLRAHRRHDRRHRRHHDYAYVRGERHDRHQDDREYARRRRR